MNKAGIPWAIVTSGSMPVARARHKVAGLPAPEVFVTAERVKRGKPEPDAYLLGAQLLGLAPQECVVVEDAPAGVLSGLAAGCHVIAVNAPADTPRLNEVDLVLHSLEQITVTKQPMAMLLFSETPDHDLAPSRRGFFMAESSHPPQLTRISCER